MEIFNIDYSVCVTDLFREMFKFKKYKAMSLPVAIFVGIFMIPFTALSFVMAGFIYLLHFFIKILMIPTDFLHGVLRDEKDHVSNPAQVVVYLVSWPVVFLGRIFMAFLVFFLNLFYVFYSISSFTWSLGAFRFHLFINKLSDSYIETEGNYKKMIPMIFILISIAILLVLPFISVLVLLLENDAYRLDTILNMDFGDAMDVLLTTFRLYFLKYLPLHCLVAFFYNIFLFAPKPNCRKAVTAEAASVEATASVAKDSSVDSTVEESVEI